MNSHKKPIVRLQRQKHPGFEWEYKVVQMVSTTAPDPDDASRKLGGSISVETLRSEFPEYYSSHNGRQQISDFLNQLGKEGWELIQIQNIVDLPLMVFKRPKSVQNSRKKATSLEEPKRQDERQEQRS